MSECHIILTFFLLYINDLQIDNKARLASRQIINKHSEKMSLQTAKNWFGMKYE